MDRNYDFNKFDKSNMRNLKGESINTSSYYKKQNRNNDDLIIDDNTVYEIDPDCYERLKRTRMNQNKDFGRKN